MDTREAEQQKTAPPTSQNGRGHDAVAETERKGPPKRIIFGVIGAIVGSRRRRSCRHQQDQ
jgi:hypothetical protein